MTSDELKVFRRLVTAGRRKMHALGRDRAPGRNAVECAVEDAMQYLNGNARDRFLWEGAAYVIGHENFLLLLHERIARDQSEKPPRNRRSAFSSKLKCWTLEAIHAASLNSHLSTECR